MTNDVKVRSPTIDHNAARRERRECCVAMVGCFSLMLRGNYFTDHTLIVVGVHTHSYFNFCLPHWILWDRASHSCTDLLVRAPKNLCACATTNNNASRMPHNITITITTSANCQAERRTDKEKGQQPEGGKKKSNKGRRILGCMELMP